MKKIWRVLSLVVLILGGIGLLIQPASARELAQTDVVDSFKVTEKRLVQGQQTAVTVHFSAKADTKIQPADTLTFTMPQELMGITEQGDRTRQVPLGDLGEVAIFKDRVVVTFNDNVESLNGVRGNFNFGIETRRTEKKEPVVILTNFGTLLDPIEINVLGQRDPQQGEQRELPFFYKVGDQQGAANQIRWFLNVNLNKADLGSDITLRDTSGVGQTVNPDSFRILVDNTEARRELTLADFENQAYGKMHFQPSGVFDLTFNRDKARFTAFNVIYTTSLTQKGLKQKQLKNHYELHYEPITGPNKDEEGTAIVNNLFASGEANGDKFEKHADEVVEEQPVETVESIEPETIEPRVAEESVVETPSEQAQVTQPEVHANEVVEEQPVETVESIEPETIEPRVAEESVVETPSEQAQVTQPEVHANEVVEEQPVETVEPIEPEQVQPQQAEEKVVETPSEQAQVTQPEVHANEVVEEQPVEMVEPIEPEQVQPQQAEEKVVETPSEQAQVTQPEVHANEVVEEQPVEMVEPIE
ncbi:collagen binding domain-containing protein, partial [Weissella minor]|uniref:collagen binding domain-containing protein n=1 Tax=Weissella minor TaxID=1620 RepID=UPI003AF2409F